ncbi:MAG: SLC13 family permease [Alphaproteobacteria bacterium]
MEFDQAAVFAILAAAMALFVWGRWRYDVVAVAALIACVFAGVVPMDRAFAGFGHPAVVVVAVVLAISRAFINSGLIDTVGAALTRAATSRFGQRAALVSLAAALSMFMNNVGALALMMPVAMQTARGAGRSPAGLLMPIAFGSILGGLVTLIGTPPNIIIAAYRAEVSGAPFGMFDFTPVGLPVLLVGLVYMLLLGWRLLPRRRADADQAMFEIGDYVTELRVTEGSPAVDKTVAMFERALKSEAEVLGLIPGGDGPVVRGRQHHLRPGDILLMQLDPGDLAELTDADKLEVVGDVEALTKGLKDAELTLVEAVVGPNSRLVGLSALGFGLRRRLGLSLLAVARQGQPIRRRIRLATLRAGDVLLVQGDAGEMPDHLRLIGCMPLAERGLKISVRKTIAPLAIFAAAIATAATGVLPVPVALLAALFAMVVGGMLPLREAYEAVDWPVIILLGAMIPVGGALGDTGGTALIADGIIALAGDLPVWVIVAIVLVVAMTLSDVMNNAATAVVMAPIAAAIAQRMGVDADPFLMAVAVGASCAFLTPIGHQNNTLVMGPGGYHFGDYWRMGLPLEIAVIAVAVPLIMLAWPP